MLMLLLTTWLLMEMTWTQPIVMEMTTGDQRMPHSNHHTTHKAINTNLTTSLDRDQVVSSLQYLMVHSISTVKDLLTLGLILSFWTMVG